MTVLIIMVSVIGADVSTMPYRCILQRIVAVMLILTFYILMSAPYYRDVNIPIM